MLKRNFCTLACSILLLKVNANTFGDSTQKINIYPSVTFMQGVLYYSFNSGAKNQPAKFINSNQGLLYQLNAELKLSNAQFVQFYAGYNHWNYADLFPVGAAFKVGFSQKTEPLECFFGGGYSFGKRFYDNHDAHYPTTASPPPEDLGAGKMHIRLGLNKFWTLKSAHCIGAHVLFNIQVIRSYYADTNYGPPVTVTYFRNMVTYKFAGVGLSFKL